VINVGGNFIFVWILLGLLFFYIFSIKIGSAGIFATGNIVVEAILVLYLMRYRKSGQIGRAIYPIVYLLEIDTLYKHSWQ